MKEGRTRQEHVEDALLEALADGRPRTTAELNKAVRILVPPLAVDNVQAHKRANESKYDAIISNALQSGRGLCAGNFVERIEIGVFRITACGKDKHSNNMRLLSSALKSVDELYPEGFN